MQLADENDLPHVIRIVRADVRDFRRQGLQLVVINSFNKHFQFDHYLVELLDRIAPFFAVKVVEGFVIVAAEFLFRLSFKLDQLPLVPEQQMIAELPDSNCSSRMLRSVAGLGFCA